MQDFSTSSSQLVQPSLLLIVHESRWHYAHVHQQGRAFAEHSASLQPGFTRNYFLLSALLAGVVSNAANHMRRRSFSHFTLPLPDPLNLDWKHVVEEKASRILGQMHGRIAYWERQI